MTDYAAVARELRGAPWQDERACRWVHCAGPEVHAIVRQFFVDNWCFDYSDAISEAVEFCERMAAIEGCRSVDLLGQHGPPGCEVCPECQAEYRRCKDGVCRWI